LQTRSSPANKPLATNANPRRTLLPVFFYFLAAGVPTVMLGPLLPTLMQRWNIQDAQAGTLFTASFMGQFCGAWVATRNLRASVLYGSAITAAGCAAMAWAGFGFAHIALFVIGLGLGAGLTAGNVIGGTAIPASRARLIAALNVAWGLGAIACPVVVRLSSGGIQNFFFATAAFVAVASLLSINIPPAPQRADEDALVEFSPQPAKTSAADLRSPMPLPSISLLIFAFAVFVYVGVENALGGWLPSYAVRTNPTLHPSSISLYFWIAELAGRILVTALLSLLGEAVLYRICLALLILTQIVLCAVAPITPAGVITLTILAALSLAPLYPLITSFLLARTGNHAKLGPLFACASIGGATLPWLTGVVSTHFHGLRAGLLIPATGAVLLLGLSTAITSPVHTQDLATRNPAV
jgi:FHS family glucose/mannose:H+ symporter-like MFS transporter